MMNALANPQTAKIGVKGWETALETAIEIEEYECDCEETAIHYLRKLPDDIPMKVKKSIAHQRCKWRTYEFHRQEHFENRLEIGRRGHRWNRKSKRAQKEIGIRKLRKLSL